MPTTAENPFLTAALAYAARGWRVVPLKAKDKGPWIKDWVNAASTDAEQLAKWWGLKPASNVGVALGEGSGLVAIDVDTEAGMERLQAMAEGDFPETAEMVTGKGVRYLFSIPKGLGVELRQVVLRDSNGQEDLRFQSGGGQCVMPPSIHPSGKVYAWVEDRGPEALAPMPAWLIEAMRPAEKPTVITSPANTPPASSPPAPPRPSKDPAEVLKNRIIAYLGKCPASVEGQRGHDDLFRAARALVVGFCLSDAEALAYLNNYFNPRCQPEWNQRELQHKVADARSKPFSKPMGYLRDSANPHMHHPPEREVVKPGEATAATAAASSLAGPMPEAGISAADLVLVDFPPLKYALDGLIVEGLTILGGRPKKGKSWLSLVIGWAVAGGHQLDGRKTTQGEVLYLALEDTKRRLKDRILKLQGGVNPWPIPPSLHLHTSWPRGADGIQALGERLSQANGSIRLVIIDTLARFRTPPKGQGSGYADDYEAVAAIKAVADTYGASVLVIHHTRKMKADDPFDELSGTLGLTGAADGIWMLDSGAEKSADLFVTGRDIAESTIPLNFDSSHCRWILGDLIDGVVKGNRVAPNKPNKVDQCKSWLKDFLSQYAHPSKEIETAAKVAGFSFAALRDAKAALGRSGTGEVTHHNFGSGSENDWWSGLGPLADWKYRPGTDRPRGAPESQESHRKKPGRRDQTGESGESESEVF